MAKLCFGKYVNISIDFINSGYLKWLVDEDWFDEKYPEHAEAVEDELNKRDHEQSHFYKDKVHV